VRRSSALVSQLEWSSLIPVAAVREPGVRPV
jgi:hypothetical protein